MRSRPWLRLAAGLVLAASLAACTGVSHHSPAAPGNGGIGNTAASPAPGDSGGAAAHDGGVPDPAGDITLPLDAYTQTEYQINEIEEASIIVTGECVRRAGFSFDEAQFVAFANQFNVTDIGDYGLYGALDLYGPTVMQAAEKYGYHHPSDINDPQPSNGPVVSFKTSVPGFGKISHAEFLVIAGTSPSTSAKSCDAKGSAAVNAAQPSKSLTDLAATINKDSYDRSLTAPPVLAAFQKWSACMAAKGYHYPNPTKAGDNLDLETSTVSPQERATAVADVACKSQTHLVAIWSGWMATYQRQQIDTHAQALQELKRAYDKQTRVVDDIIAAGGH